MRSLLTSSLLRSLLALGSAAAALAVVVTLLVGLGGGPRPADAVVVPAQGFQATVLGWSSWYGSYDLTGIGHAWCIDHGSHAPDADLAYAPTDVPEAHPDTKAAMAWALGNHPAYDAIDAAATMLVMHDLMGAQYPFGALDVHVMGPGDLAGFGGHEATVLERARSIKDDALAHRHLRGPYALHAEAPAVAAGAQADLTVRLTDANGAPVERATVHVHADGAQLLAGHIATTGTDGVARLPYRAAEGANRFLAVAVASDPALHAWGPTAAPAQRVARPGAVQVSAHAGFDVQPPDGGIELDKVDGATGEPLAGAVFDLAFDGDGDGAFETPIQQLTTAAEPVVATGLRPGDYQLTEVAAPPGYHPLLEPFVVTVPPGQVVEVDVANTPRSTVAFEKVPAGDVDPAQVTLAGAVFVVTGPHDPPTDPPIIGDEGPDSGEDDPPSTDDAGEDDEPGPDDEDAPGEAPEVGRCTTGPDGRCALPELALLSHRRYCYREVVAPAGFGPVEPGCFTAGPPATVHTVVVDEPSTFTEIDGDKRDAVDGRPLAGAVYDLYRATPEGDPVLPTPPAPDDAEVLDGHTWVGRAESDEDGRLDWPLQLPGHRYCAVEHRAPEGYARADEPVCSDVLVAGEPVRLTLLDEPAWPPGTVPGPPRAEVPPPPPRGGPPATVTPTPTPGGPRRQSTLPVAGGGSTATALAGAGMIVLGAALAAVARRHRTHR